jgi:hypothetical protein
MGRISAVTGEEAVPLSMGTKLTELFGFNHFHSVTTHHVFVRNEPDEEEDDEEEEEEEDDQGDDTNDNDDDESDDGYSE